MRYLSFRIDSSAIRNHFVVPGFFVYGQRPSDLNWSFLAQCESMSSAVDYACFLLDGSPNQFIYGPDGYCIEFKEV